MVERREQFDYEDLLACARGELFGPGNAQLPLPPMLMFDRISEVKEEGGEHGYGRIVAELDVKPDLWFFPCHFKGDPVMPRLPRARRAVAAASGFFLGWLGGSGARDGRSASARSNSPAWCCDHAEAGIYRRAEAGDPRNSRLAPATAG
jgi:3-hydroxymyristoyl/3-hydroxydecanoyl-(acyl carrier protein) dehydratase